MACLGLVKTPKVPGPMAGDPAPAAQGASDIKIGGGSSMTRAAGEIGRLALRTEGNPSTPAPTSAKIPVTGE